MGYTDTGVAHPAELPDAGGSEIETVDLSELDAPGAGPAGSSGRRPRRILRTAGEVLITLGMVALLFAVYEIYGKTAIINSHQEQLEQQLNQQWTDTPPPRATGGGGGGQRVNPAPPPGSTLARLWIPVLRLHWVVVEGVDLGNLAYGPGHYPGTAMPGQVGNFSVAGHRIPAVFWDLQLVQPGDPIVVETRDYWYLYQVTVNEILTPTSIQAVAPTPDKIGVRPTQAMLTLTTCNPKWANFQRMIVHARLISKSPHSAGPPVPLGS